MPAIARAEYYFRPLVTSYSPSFHLTTSVPQIRGNNVEPLRELVEINDETAFSGGPGQPEMQSFSSVNGDNMVDLFTGDFSYSIPLLDVGGYPLTLGYKGGVSMEQEASWVGLGWNVNPGTISRNMRGLPDDFTGEADSIRKVTKIAPNNTTGVTVGADLEIAGGPQSTVKGGIGVSLGLFKNTYKGWGMESGLNASIRVASSSKGGLSGGLSFANNSQEGLTISPSFSVNLLRLESDDKGGYGGSFSVSSPYNARTGIRVLQMSAGITQYDKKNDNDQRPSYGTNYGTKISFASPTFVPGIQLPYTSQNISFTGKLGSLVKVLHPSVFISGYQSKQYIADEDTVSKLPAYGYLNYQHANDNSNALLDFNREKEIPYREKPAVPHIALPFYTPDVFSISGEGTGGMFRAYRGDVGWVRDHFLRSKDMSTAASVDIGVGDLVHAGVDLNVNRSITQTGAWEIENAAKSSFRFRRDSVDFQASYFKNPGEKAIIDKDFYEAVGGDDLVSISLYQPGSSSSLIQATNKLNRYKNKQISSVQTLESADLIRKKRDKRTQVISYLTATEAEAAGLSKMIESYTPGQFSIGECYPDLFPIDPITGVGMTAVAYANKNLDGPYTTMKLDVWDSNWKDKTPFIDPLDITKRLRNNFSVRWIARLRAPKTGRYIIRTRTDDGVRMWVNDSLRINDWRNHAATNNFTTLYLTEGKFYDIKIEYFEYRSAAMVSFRWNKPGDAENVFTAIPKDVFFDVEEKVIHYPHVTKEKRVKDYRKASHISEITVLNNDGKRYVYGIPVYNLKQVESSFSVRKDWADAANGMTYYTPQAASTQNDIGRDKYFTKEEIPAYAHSYLLTGLLSPDYVDLTGDGITDDDLGDAIKFNYSRIAGIDNPFGWRAPHATDSVSYNEGLKTDSRDDRGSVVYGTKELWYLHSVVSKTMVATFHLENRSDVRSVDITGRTTQTQAKRLKEIRLYSKAEFLQKGIQAIPIKTVHFEYSYELCQGIYQGSSAGKLTLKSVYFTYKGNARGKRNKYQFHYSGNNPRFRTAHMDRWGSYKNPIDNPGSNSNQLVTNSEYSYSVQDSLLAAQNAGAWALDSIALPSGGSMKVNYESDDYAYVQNKRSMQLFTIAGFGRSANADPSDKLYGLGGDNLYLFVDYTGAAINKRDLYNRFLKGIQKVLIRVAIKMPTDQFGSGTEYVNCYVDLDGGDYYGMVNANRFWIRVKGVSKEGTTDGPFSPIVKAASQFLRLNLPSKAFIGSENDGNLGVKEAVNMLVSQGENIKEALLGYELNIRSRYQLSEVDLSRSFIRLHTPNYKKYGGGHRVKSIKVYDNWNRMTQQRPMVYGQEYIYSQIDTIDGRVVNRSTGVASFEPGIGGEENPFRMPLEYLERTGILGPVTLGYTELPLGESLFPSPMVGYSQVRVRSLHHKGVKSASGVTETQFYTAYDYPVVAEHSLLDNDTKKRYRPSISNFLRINAKHFIGLSQGFKIELNDMHGKLKAQAAYAESDLTNPITYSKYVYKTEAGSNKLSNTVLAIHPNGNIDTTAIIGKEVELMVDMREQLSVTNGNNVNLNADIFNIPSPPLFFVIPSIIPLPQREENKYRSVAVTKVIQRYGILDSVIVSDKGSIVTTKDILYDAETGDVLLNRTNNSFKDPVYTFNYPTHWAYEGMGLAYKNLDIVLRGLEIRDGKIVTGLTGSATEWLFPGDEILVNGSEKTGTINACEDQPATFGEFRKLWVLSTKALGSGTDAVYLVDEAGKPYTGYNASIKVIRSGRRNQMGTVGSVAMRKSPIKYDALTQHVNFNIDNGNEVIQANAAEFQENWKVNNSFKRYYTSVPGTNCPAGYTYSDSLKLCIKDTVPIYSAPVSICVMTAPYGDYSRCGAMVYSSFTPSFSSFSRRPIAAGNSFWESPTPCGTTPVNEKTETNVIAFNTFNSQEGLEHDSINSSPNVQGKSNSLLAVDPNCIPSSAPRYGPMNRSSIWLCCDSVIANEVWWGFTRPIEVPTDGVYFIGFGADNLVKISIDDNLIVGQTNGSEVENFRIWHLVPVYLTSGTHRLKIEATDFGAYEGVGVEIYNNTVEELEAATDTSHLNYIFSTANLINETIPSDVSCPFNYQLIEENSLLKCRSTVSIADSIFSSACFSLLDTSVNVYTRGLSGNWRPYRQMVFYGDRVETNPETSTNIRTNGVISNFDPFWAFDDSKLAATSDTSKWVWNTKSTLFNNRGLELENLDPLGRYNAGLYGYKHTLPIAVVSNSTYQEAMFDGFEDYGFDTQNCDTACVSSRHIDFSAYKFHLDTTHAHSGRYSLKLDTELAAAAVTVPVVASVTAGRPQFDVQNKQHACATMGTVLEQVRTDSSALLSSYRPIAGRKMVLSAWVKESVPCSNGTYTNNQINIVDNGGNTFQLLPKGAVIEGWQRYEAVVDIHPSSSFLTVEMKALNGSTVYFDDIRMHPYHANMKSFVYDANDMRLMAELDENNYATFYEYDDEGTLIRLKKETIRGIQTIKETRSALQKN